MLKTNNRKKHYILIGALVALVLLIDQVIKIWVKSSFDNTPINIFGEWFRMVYVENPGMAFGTTFGAGIWPKLTLSLLRIGAIVTIIFYILKRIKEGVSTEFVIVGGLVLSGALGNLVDSMFYDFIFTFDPCYYYNFQEGSGIFHDCQFFGKVEVRPQGFLMGNVVDMFQFNFTWPNWVPYLGGQEVFPAVWNIADGAISVAVIWIFIRYKTLIKK
jgi:signal peptidase II